MSVLSAGELTLLRNSHPHAIQLYMSVYVPEVIYCGTITGTPARADITIHVSDILLTETPLPGMEVRVGTSCGAYDVSVRRLREFNDGADTIKVDENGVDWQVGQYISIVNFRPLFPKYPFITDTPPYTFCKDLDIPYTDENEFPQPVAMIGLTEPKFLDGSSVVYNLDGSNSYAIAVGATITGYSWSCVGGTLSTPSSATTTLTFTQSGTYTLKLTVTDSNGKTQFQDRYVFVHPRTGDGAPYVDFEFASPPAGNWSAGGWNASVRVRGNADITEFPDGAYTVIWADMYWDGVLNTVGDSGCVILAGYIRRDTITKDLDTGDVVFDITTIQDLLDIKLSFSVSLTDLDTPTKWYEYKNITVARAIHHLWNEHSTLFNIADVHLPMSNTLRLPAVDDFTNGTLYTLPDSFALQHGIFAHVCCNKFGQVHVEEELNMLNDADRAAVVTVMTITDRDRRGEADVQIVRNTENRVAMTMLSGVSYDGTTTTPLISKFPGEAPEADGPSIVNLERQVLASQAQSNELVGRAQAVANNPILEERIPFAGNYIGALDIVPQQWFNQDLPADSNKRGLVLTGVKITPRVVEVEVQQDVLFVRAAFESDATGYDGIPGRYPTEPPAHLPPAPPPEVFPLNTVAFNDAGSCHVRSVVGGNWTLRDGSLSGSDVQDHHGGEDPWWWTDVSQNTDDPAFAILIKCNTGKIYRTVNCGVTWVDVTPVDDPPNGEGDVPAPTSADLTYIQYEGNYLVLSEHYVLAEQEASGEWRSWIRKTTDNFSTGSWIQLEETAP